jgi:hypothetical protein
VIIINTIIQARRFEYLFSAGKSLAFLINTGGTRKPEKFFGFFLEAARRQLISEERRSFLSLNLL